jgi:SAM-dependent methyltransferase
VVAKWWAAFNTDGGPELPFYQRFVEAGQPALDVGCGTGRLLIPFLHAGLQVDGCDVSADMVHLCRERAEREGLAPDLRVQAMHELDWPGRYRTIYLCGAFGIGSTRAEDEVALARMYEHLEPGGTLLLDKSAPYDDPGTWACWTKEQRKGLPGSWNEPMGRTTDDGDAYELAGRLIDVNPYTQRVTMELRGSIRRDGRLVEEDTHLLTQTEYMPHELLLMLDRAGFTDIEVRGDFTDDQPTADTETVVCIARRPDNSG